MDICSFTLEFPSVLTENSIPEITANQMSELTKLLSEIDEKLNDITDNVIADYFPTIKKPI